MIEHESISQLTPQQLILHRELFNWALNNGTAITLTNPEQAAGWGLLAAKIANTFGNERLASPSLEHFLIQLAASIPSPTVEPSGTGTRRWLHVFSEAYRTGGHTALAERWIAADSGHDQHSVALTFQKKVDVPMLAATVNKKGGEIFPLGDINSLIARATQLRQLAWRNADVVVMHTHMWDIVALLAFGIPGGPPVMLLNHADHAFWVGASVSDKVIHIRDSGRMVAEKWRGVDRHCYLPIPLPEPAPAPASLREQVRRDLAIPADAPVFLTIGSQFKYMPIGDLSFLSVARQILSNAPSAWLIAIGPTAAHPDWQAAHAETGGRLLVLGKQFDLHKFHIAADVYLEGFPFGSLTALLEAGMTGLACIRAPKACPPPFTSDGTALNDFPQPSDLNEYAFEAVRLATDPIARRQHGEALKARIKETHTGSGWQTHLVNLKAELPVAHHNYPVDAPIAHSLWEQYWAPFLAQQSKFDPILYSFITAKIHGLNPRFNLRLLALAIRCRGSTRPTGTPGALTLWLFASLLDPVITELKYCKSTDRTQWWPLLVVRYWANRHIGWRFRRLRGKGEQ